MGSYHCRLESMMGYGDITWCKGDGCKKFDTCPRAFNEAQKQRAKRWWGSDDYPVCYYSFPPELDCYEANPTETSLKEEAGTG